MSLSFYNSFLGCRDFLGFLSLVCQYRSARMRLVVE